jgi:hypothetical protein
METFTSRSLRISSGLNGPQLVCGKKPAESANLDVTRDVA